MSKFLQTLIVQISKVLPKSEIPSNSEFKYVLNSPFVFGPSHHTPFQAAAMPADLVGLHTHGPFD
jgi:hypothetical protein